VNARTAKSGKKLIVIPAGFRRGFQQPNGWYPVPSAFFRGTRGERKKTLDSRFRGNDVEGI
jgi:hypothetical protein